MKTKIEYEKLTPEQVVEIGNIEGWPIYSLCVSRYGDHWYADTVRAVLIGAANWHFVTEEAGYCNYCARKIERIKWEENDLVECADGEIRGRIDFINLSGEVAIADPDTGSILGYRYGKNLKPWIPGYGYTSDGKIIIAPEGREIVPEGGEIPAGYMRSTGGNWFVGNGTSNGKPAECRNGIRAYARRIKTPKRFVTVEMVDKAFELGLPDEKSQHITKKINRMIGGNNE